MKGYQRNLFSCPSLVDPSLLLLRVGRNRNASIFLEEIELFVFYDKNI
jgi:hypothetical protein